MKTKIIQITVGRGPAECSWVVAQVLKLFLEEIKAAGYDYLVLHREKGIQNGTVQSATIQLIGKEINTFLSTWLGTIQWVGTSTFRKYHKRKNWYIGMYEIKQVEQLRMKEQEISFQTMRSTGPGGQNVNKVNSAVRATYRPTGDQVVVMDSRSQHQNKKIAIERLKEKVYKSQLQKIQKSLCDQWENHLNVERGNPIRKFKGTDFKKIKKKQSFASNRQQLKNDLRNELKY
ncbi:peptide chain release factor H [Aquimarina litoralis]|uniref:peptide chain release factor H n=1 Tax=Aquimarina litoralis TaxID=584605 RepID=UPI001C57D6F0|nr:peptide chain release factor H [Aquimarina litoralis]MBW1297336.1 peptide chain release factor H [Aquimarina litoralis]